MQRKRRKKPSDIELPRALDGRKEKIRERQNILLMSERVKFTN